ncbi:N-acetyltransferase family protein [Lentzea sp. CA-135723]|uniref:GNAT family N-acetyltransferase n=1 Tax=Lentzea sp. CA-135723 TaxID=3239950 RepID=UPI003D8FA1C5
MTPPPLFEPIYLRKATISARPALRAMLTRCTDTTLRERFWATATTAAEDDALTELVGDMRMITAVEVYIDTISHDDQATVLAWQGDRVVAAGSLLPVCALTAEIALIVEDTWQAKGLGSLLVALLAEIATQARLEFLCAYLGADNIRARQLITRFCPEARFLAPDNGVVDVVIPVRDISPTACGQHQIDSTGRWSQ